MAVKRFQEINGLIADGFLGPNTMSLLNSSDAKANGLQLGMEGSDVTNVQKRLKELNYMDAVTGYYGSLTEEAVKAFQKRNGLSADGKVGKVTMNALMDSDAKKASSGLRPRAALPPPAVRPRAAARPRAAVRRTPPAWRSSSR